MSARQSRFPLLAARASSVPFAEPANTTPLATAAAVLAGAVPADHFSAPVLALNANSPLPGSAADGQSPMCTTPLTTAGVVASAAHVARGPGTEADQAIAPVSVRSAHTVAFLYDETKTTPFATAGDESTPAFVIDFV